MHNFSNTIRRVNGDEKGSSYSYYPVLVIGAGESGIALGCRLREVLGFDQFRIFDRQAGIGGTWWINRYPKVACDIPACFYSFSFSPNPKWTKLFPEGAEILAYLQWVCDKYQINDKIQVNTDVTELRWLEDEGQWEVLLTHMAPGAGDLSSRDRQQRIKDCGRESVHLSQEVVRAKVVVSAAGGLVEPNSFPNSIPGLEDFQGEIFHSARWKQEVDLNGKDVLVVGTGCSAAQFVPALIEAPYNVKSVTQVMRSPPWVVPKDSPPGGTENWEKWSPFLFDKIPGLARCFRTMLFGIGEFFFFTIFKDSPKNKKNREKLEAQLLAHMRNTVPEKYHKILTPDYGVGCKRRIFDDAWFTALNDPKCNLTTQPLTRIRAQGVTLGPGRTYPNPEDKNSQVRIEEVEIPADVIILANGFELTTWLHPIKIYGKGGVLMQDVWDERGGAQAYMGAAMDGYPNFFMIFGPNTATGHSSVILATENMINYSLLFIKKILAGDVTKVEVRKEAEVAWTKDVQAQLKRTVVSSGGCHSWYKTGDGWNSTLYPYSQIDFSLRCMFPRWTDWDLEYTSKGILKKRIRQALQYGLVIGAIIGAYQIKKGGGSLVDLPGRGVEYFKKELIANICDNKDSKILY